MVFPAVRRGSDVAFDPVHNRYLIVACYGSAVGSLVDTSGNTVAGPFTISTGFGHCNYLRAAYSAQLGGGQGGFMVVWSSEDSGSVVRSRPVGFDGTLGVESVVSDGGGHPSLEAAPAIAYSQTSQQFLVAWQGASPLGIYTRLINLAGATLGSAVNVAPGFGRDPGVAWNPNRNEFGVSFSGENFGVGGYSVFAIVPAANPAAFRRTIFNTLGGGALTFITDLGFSAAANQYVMTWYERIANTRSASFDEDGNLVRNDLVSTHVGVYDSLALAFNPLSQTFLMVGLNTTNDQLAGLELTSSGTPASAESALMTGPAFYARVGANQSAAQWDATISRNFVIQNRIIGTSSGGGGPQPPPPTPPAPPPANNCPGADPFAIMGGGTCVNGNWLPPGMGAPAPPPTSPPSTAPPPAPVQSSNCPGSDPFAIMGGGTCYNGNWLPPGIAPPRTSTPPPTTPPPPTTAGCPGSDPFATIGGGTCVNGNWLPPGIALPLCVGGTPPVAGWVRDAQGNWLPPDHPAAITAVCRTQ